MNLQSILGISLASVSLACSIGFLIHQPDSQESKPNVLSPPASYVEYMSESGEESYRLHVLNKDGVEDKIYIRYKDKSLGILHLGPNGKTAQKRRFFLDGTVKEESNFDENGILLSGFEHRSDRRLLWQTALSVTQGKTVTRVYWPNGALFLEREFELGTRISSSTFFRADGSLWQRSDYKGDYLTLQMTYDENGHLRIMQRRPETGSQQAAESQMFAGSVPQPIFEVVYFNEDGKPDFGQWFAHSANLYYDASDGKTNPNPVIIVGVDVYSEGKLTSRYELSGELRVKVIDQIAANGTITRGFVQRDGLITRQDTITATGSSTTYDFQGRFGVAPPVDSRYLVPPPENNVPYRQFNEIQARLSKEAQ